MKLFITSCLMMMLLPGKGQSVLQELEKYHINISSINSLTSHPERQFNFKLKTTIVTESNVKAYEAQHYTGKGKDSTWVLMKVNNSDPSAADRAAFEKLYTNQAPPLLIDTSTLQLLKNDGKDLVISYRYDPALMTDANRFMEACVIKLFIDTVNGRLRAEGNIEKPFKIKMLKANYLSSTTTYVYDKTTKGYLLQKEEVSINLKILGRDIDMITTNEYSYHGMEGL